MTHRKILTLSITAEQMTSVYMYISCVLEKEKYIRYKENYRENITISNIVNG